jgi:hypothetical protein
MASAISRSPLERFRTAPTRGIALAAITGVVWLIGALYCSGYERLLSGLDNWPGSLVWSAVAILPWLALFEWSKSRAGRRITEPPINLLLALVITGVLSLSLGRLIADGPTTSLALSVLRRLPAVGVGLLLILWSRAGARAAQRVGRNEPGLSSVASAIDWVEAADNYVELHIAGRTVMRRMTMRDAERALRNHGFVRVHRRFLVNADRICAIDGTNGDRVVRLANGAELPVGRAFAANLSRAA